LNKTDDSISKQIIQSLNFLNISVDYFHSLRIKQLRSSVGIQVGTKWKT